MDKKQEKKESPLKEKSPKAVTPPSGKNAPKSPTEKQEIPAPKKEKESKSVEKKPTPSSKTAKSADKKASPSESRPEEKVGFEHGLPAARFTVLLTQTLHALTAF